MRNTSGIHPRIPRSFNYTIFYNHYRIFHIYHLIIARHELLLETFRYLDTIYIGPYFFALVMLLIAR